MSRAAEKGDRGVAELLLKAMAQPDLEDKPGCMPLSRAIERGNAAIVELLLTQGAKANFRYKLVSKFNGSILELD